MYITINDGTAAVKETFFDTLKEEMCHKQTITYNLGDLNGRIGRRTEDNTLGCFGEDFTIDRWFLPT